MSTGRTNDLDAFPRASLLTYFRHPREPERSSRYYERPPPKYTTHASCSPHLESIPEAESEDTDAGVDEESQLGFWGEKTHCSTTSAFDCGYESEKGGCDKGCRWNFFDTLGLVCYALLVLILLLNLNVFLRRLDIGMPLVDRDGHRLISVADMGNEMHFCLVSSRRDAPTSRVWRYVTLDSANECQTQIATLIAEPTEAWKIFPDDKILVGEAGQDRDEEDEHPKFIG